MKLARTAPLLLLLIAGATAFLAVSSQSLWIDEANSAVKAIVPTWSEFVAKMSVERGSDLQMPGYMILLWIWEKAFGPSEYGLRSLNIPFFLGALTVICFGLRASFQRKLLFVIFTCSSAFLWAYLDEARPYMFQFFGSVLVMTGLYNMATQNKRDLTIVDTLYVLLGIVLLLASSLSTLFFALILGLIFLSLIIKSHSTASLYRNRTLLFFTLLTILSVTALGVYYFWTLRVGAKASAVGRTNLTSIIFCFYELAGFTGIGPSRGELRIEPFQALGRFLPILAVYAGALGCLCLLCLASIWDCPGKWLKVISILTFAMIVGIAMMIALGLTTHFRVLGRHLMPSFPFLLLAISVAADRAIAKFGRVALGAIGMFIVLSLFSSLQIRLAVRHAKDDYRSASAFAKATIASGGTVWWVADKAGAEYYGLPVGVPDQKVMFDPKVAVNLVGFNDTMRAALQSPTIVILSKEDIYDPQGYLQSWMAAHHYSISHRFTSFTVSSLR